MDPALSPSTAFDPVASARAEIRACAREACDALREQADAERASVSAAALELLQKIESAALAAERRLTERERKIEARAAALIMSIEDRFASVLVRDVPGPDSPSNPRHATRLPRASSARSAPFADIPLRRTNSSERCYAGRSERVSTASLAQIIARRDSTVYNAAADDPLHMPDAPRLTAHALSARAFWPSANVWSHPSRTLDLLSAACEPSRLDRIAGTPCMRPRLQAAILNAMLPLWHSELRGNLPKNTWDAFQTAIVAYVTTLTDASQVASVAGDEAVTPSDVAIDTVADLARMGGLSDVTVFERAREEVFAVKCAPATDSDVIEALCGGPAVLPPDWFTGAFCTTLTHTAEAVAQKACPGADPRAFWLFVAVGTEDISSQWPVRSETVVSARVRRSLCELCVSCIVRAAEAYESALICRIDRMRIPGALGTSPSVRTALIANVRRYLGLPELSHDRPPLPFHRSSFDTTHTPMVARARLDRFRSAPPGWHLP